MVETHKILKIYEKEFKNFTAFNLNVNRNGEQTWLNGYLSKENRAWKEGDTVTVEVWFDEKGERWKYKPADEGSQQNNQSQHGPPPQGGSGVPNSPDGVSNAELKHLLVKIGKFLAKMDEKLDALAAKPEPKPAPKSQTAQEQSQQNSGPYQNQQRPEAEQQDNSGPQAPWDTIDDDLPF